MVAEIAQGRSIARPLLGAWVIWALLLLQGCQLAGQPPAEAVTNAPTCHIPHGTDVAKVFSQSRDQLAHSECQFRFDAFFDNLLKTAAGDPDPDHNRRFSDFLLWANRQGIITRVTAEAYYNRYFGVKFVSLPSDYSNCAYTCRMKEKVLDNMQKELQDKDEGLLKVTANKQKYVRASSLYDAMVTLLEATCSTCNNPQGQGGRAQR